MCWQPPASTRTVSGEVSTELFENLYFICYATHETDSTQMYYMRYYIDKTATSIKIPESFELPRRRRLIYSPLCWKRAIRSVRQCRTE